MAYSSEQWQQARGYYEAGLSLSKIKDKTGIARNTVSKRAKKEQWEHGANADYVEAREIVVEKKGTILEQKGTLFLNALDEVADDNIRYKKLINDNATKLANKLALMTDEVAEPQDLRHLVEANDKLSITLGVNERHAPKQVTAVQVNTDDKKDPIVGMKQLYGVINE